MRIGIFGSATMVAIFEADPRTAWRAAVAYVRGMAHGDGVEGGSGFTRRQGEVVYERGAYCARGLR